MRIAIAFIVLLLSAPSWAADLLWQVNGVPGKFASPSAACQAWLQKINEALEPWQEPRTLGPVTKVGPTQYACPLYYQGQELVGAGTVAKRPADFVCPPENDDTTGECIPPPPDPCEALSGSTSSFFATVPNGGTSLPGEYVCNHACHLVRAVRLKCSRGFGVLGAGDLYRWQLPNRRHPHRCGHPTCRPGRPHRPIEQLRPRPYMVRHHLRAHRPN